MTKADWLRSEIEKLEGMKIGQNVVFNFVGRNKINEATEANAHNHTLTTIITRYKEELKVLETQI